MTVSLKHLAKLGNARETTSAITNAFSLTISILELKKRRNIRPSRLGLLSCVRAPSDVSDWQAKTSICKW